MVPFKRLSSPRAQHPTKLPVWQLGYLLAGLLGERLPASNKVSWGHGSPQSGRFAEGYPDSKGCSPFPNHLRAPPPLQRTHWRGSSCWGQLCPPTNHIPRGTWGNAPGQHVGGAYLQEVLKLVGELVQAGAVIGDGLSHFLKLAA